MTDEIMNLLAESANLLIVGMAVVFVFLTVLIGAVKLMSRVVQKFPEPNTDAFGSNNLVTKQIAQQDDKVSPQIVAAIVAAVHQYRQK
ncbi:oxaloacetate decarboxylase subunit gamma [Alteromonadaceae bacterium M269]|nr:oxaloacetate decarboxylase subunit gamma [Alteromonadaceae bacterium M269]